MALGCLGGGACSGRLPYSWIVDLLKWVWRIITDRNLQLSRSAEKTLAKEAGPMPGLKVSLFPEQVSETCLCLVSEAWNIFGPGWMTMLLAVCLSSSCALSALNMVHQLSATVWTRMLSWRQVSIKMWKQLFLVYPLLGQRQRVPFVLVLWPDISQMSSQCLLLLIQNLCFLV